MRKILLATAVFSLLGLHTYAYAQDDEGPICIPTDKVIPQMKKDGFAPVWLGWKGDKPDAAIVENKDGVWVLMKFIVGKSEETHQPELQACEVDQGNPGYTTYLKPPNPTPGEPA